MRSGVFFALFCAVLFSHFFSSPTPAAAQDDQPAPAQPSSSAPAAIPEGHVCIECHTILEDEVLTPPVEEWSQSVHRQVGVRCEDCHGGDPTNEDVAMEPDSGFLGKPEPKDIPNLCAKCHSDAKMMRAYNQRADQYDLYAGSVHGRKLMSGDAEAASCVSCHGKHKILRVKDPNSTVNRKNIPETCGGCHSKKEIFEKRRKPHNQLELYKQSRHYELFAKGDLLVPTCVDCHGNHSVISPRSERVRTVCFNCHASQAEFYKASPHWEAYKRDGEPVCLNCHKNHDVKRPTVDKFTGESRTDCIECHAEDSRAYQTGLEIQSIMKSTTAAVREASAGLQDFIDNAHGGFEVSGLVKDMDKTSSSLKELNTLTHKLDVEALKKQSGGLIKTARNVRETVDGMWSEIKKRKIALGVAWFIFLGFAWALWAKSKSIEAGRGE